MRGELSGLTWRGAAAYTQVGSESTATSSSGSQSVLAEPGGIGDLHWSKVWRTYSSHITMNYGEIGHEDRRGGGSDNGGVCIVGGALVVRALGAARRRSSKYGGRRCEHAKQMIQLICVG